MLVTSVFGPETETLVVLEVANVAVSEGPLGTVPGDQFAAVFQSPDVGLVFQVALPANVACAVITARLAVKHQLGRIFIGNKVTRSPKSHNN